MIKCYKFWATPASREDADRLSQQLWLGGNYRRTLVEIENRLRALLRGLWSLPMASVPIEDRKAWRENGGEAALKQWAQTDEYKAWRKRIQDCSYAANTRAYAAAGEAGLAWGSRLAVGEAVDQARRTTKWVDDLGHASSNRVAVQIQGSTDPERLLDDGHRSSLLSCASVIGGEDTRFRIGAELYALGERVEGYRRRACDDRRDRSGNIPATRLREVSIRTGSDGRTPIWSRLHMLMHRPLPDGYIKGAWAQRRFVGGRPEWEIVLSIDMGGQITVKRHAHQDRTAAVDLGWRRRDDGMRVAYVVDDHGLHHEFVIPIEVERRKSKSDDLRSIRDKMRNELADKLRLWVETHRGTWLDVALTAVRTWTRGIHFVKLERLWSEQRVDGDGDTYAALVAYLKQDRHLRAWQDHNLVRMRRQILGRLDAWAHDLCSRYGVIAIEDLDLTALKEKEDTARINSRSIQRLAPGEALLALKRVAPKFGCVVHELECAYTTIDCAQCGHRREIADPSQLVLTCDRCGYAEDQDRTAGRNLLIASGRLRDADGRPLDPKTARATAKKLAPRRTRKRVIVV